MNTPRTPAEAKPPRMERLARLPVFFGLAGKRTVLAGGTASAAWKAELLSAAGAQVDVFADAMSDEMLALASDPPGGAIVLHLRAWTPGDFTGAALAGSSLAPSSAHSRTRVQPSAGPSTGSSGNPESPPAAPGSPPSRGRVGESESTSSGYAMAVGAFVYDDEASRFAAAARAAGVPVNVIDNPAFCDFSFGSIVNRSPLVIGISTDGAAPVFAQAIRAKLETLIPFGFARWAEAARRWREAIKSSGLPFAARRQFWRMFTTTALREPDREPRQSDYDRLIAETHDDDADTKPGTGSITLVGAGPGDPELLTLRAVRALQSADVILIDDLVAPAILDFARREAKKMMVGKTGFAPSCRQDEINSLMVSLAKAGRRVVRLKGGDPMIFGRAGEEIATCRQARIPVEVVPGISAAQGAASRLGVSLTHRNLARRIQYVTAHGADGRLPSDIDWTSLADPVTTTVVYMPKRALAELAATAQARGLAPDTPAVAVVAATRPDQEVLAGTIANIATRLEAATPERPVLVMIGRALAQAVQDQQRRDATSLTSPPALPPRSPASSVSSPPR